MVVASLPIPKNRAACVWSCREFPSRFRSSGLITLFRQPLMESLSTFLPT